MVNISKSSILLSSIFVQDQIPDDYFPPRDGHAAKKVTVLLLLVTFKIKLLVWNVITR